MKQIVFVALCIGLCSASLVQEFEKLQFKAKLDSGSGGKIWVLLVAGSNGYYNYRHQVSKHLTCC